MSKEIIKRILSNSDNLDDEEIVRFLLKLNTENNIPPINIDERISTLKNIILRYNTRCAFNVGDIVQWKDGLKNKKIPEYGDPAIIMEILESPICDEEAPIASPYYREKLDIKLGLLNENGDFVTYHYDSNRFEVKTGREE